MANEIKIVCATRTCRAHISGPVDAPAAAVSHGICAACLKRDHPGAYYFGRRRAILERLALGAAAAAAGINQLLFKAETPKL